MKNRLYLRRFSVIMLIIFMVFGVHPVMAAEKANQKVYDFAELLTAEEAAKLEGISDKYSQKRQVDIIILTAKDTQGKDVVTYMEDFYDEKGLGYDKPHGNTVILTIDMEHREVYVAGFYKGEKYLDDSRCDLIRKKITPDLSGGNYYEAFHSFIKLSYQYMGIKPGVNPEKILFKLWFQVLVAIIVASVSVVTMAYHSGGRSTTGGSTYLDAKNSGITNRRDVYIRTETTKRKKPSNEKKSGGGSLGGGSFGGGMSGGGHSHSGSRGSF
ncbi:TPM domain-containing protein [Geosporobacter ferrireducens]|uniref:TPM domain-containing protein n=1 Tax=Geosporobacter ferrireducens TaxID=1424294 RepID=UPI000A408241|nr:TPM domain-containing protein [Geosporobacter ferrireducens]